MILVWGPCQASTSAALPTATMRSRSTAKDSACGRVLSTVQIFALVIIRSAAGLLWAKLNALQNNIVIRTPGIKTENAARFRACWTRPGLKAGEEFTEINRHDQ